MRYELLGVRERMKFMGMEVVVNDGLPSNSIMIIPYCAVRSPLPGEKPDWVFPAVGGVKIETDKITLIKGISTDAD